MEDAILRENVNVLKKNILEVTVNIKLNNSQNVLRKELVNMSIKPVFVKMDLREIFVKKNIVLITALQEDLVLIINVCVKMDLQVFLY